LHYTSERHRSASGSGTASTKRALHHSTHNLLRMAKLIE
jgi:hypothetical protein